MSELVVRWLEVFSDERLLRFRQRLRETHGVGDVQVAALVGVVKEGHALPFHLLHLAGDCNAAR